MVIAHKYSNNLCIRIFTLLKIIDVVTLRKFVLCNRENLKSGSLGIVPDKFEVA
jgi:hypothetical protein